MTAFALGPRATDAGCRLASHDTLGSTNAEAAASHARGARGPLWIVARQQTAGRGRRGRSWVSEPGNLYASLLLEPPVPLVRWPELSFVAALAVHDAILSAAPQLAGRLAIKWPNDLLLDRRKCAGILVENVAGQAAVIGVGVNCAHHPEGVAYPATDLTAAGTPVAAEALFTALAEAVAQRLAEWRGGFETIRAAWLARADGIGEEIGVRLPRRELTGRFEGLDASGRLLLRLADGTVETISAGDVFVAAEERV